MHMVTHSDVRDFVCDECGSKFSRKKDLARHKKTHDDTLSLECEICNFKCKGSFTLKSHKKNLHGEKLAFGCDMCDLTFYKNQHLMRHKIGHHSQEKTEEHKEKTDIAEEENVRENITVGKLVLLQEV